MASARLVSRASRLPCARTNLSSPVRTLTTTPIHHAEEAKSVPINSRCNDTADKYRAFMINKPLTPHLTNTTSTIANEFPSVGADKPPADQLTSTGMELKPKDSIPENTVRMTGGTQAGAPGEGANADLGVGEIEGGKFKVEPLKRDGENLETMRARLLYQSRKRGTLESDLLLSTFADTHLSRMTRTQLVQYDTFLDENDWDVYYWATQGQAVPTSHETAEGGSPDWATPAAQGKESPSMSEMPPPAANEATASNPGVDKETAKMMKENPDPTDAAHSSLAKARAETRSEVTTEWANTIGTFKPAYRPVPARWRNSEILSMLRKHVIDRSAGGVTEGGGQVGVGGEGLARGKAGGGGLGMMPELREEIRRGEGKSAIK